jgi:hypothetical protein
MYVEIAFQLNLYRHQGDMGEDKERMASFDHRASSTGRRKVRLLVVVGHGGGRQRGF